MSSAVYAHIANSAHPVQAARHGLVDRRRRQPLGGLRPPARHQRLLTHLGADPHPLADATGAADAEQAG
ncbi:hypothetical protein [Streptacidiphilus sp. PAMC 29251]